MATVKDGSFHRRNKSTVCLWRERPSTCSSPEDAGHSWAANFLSSFSTGSFCFTPCSSLCDPVSISKPSSLMFPHLYHLITVCTLFLRISRLVPSSPYYNCHRFCLLSSSLNCPVANTDFARLLLRFMGLN